jgi:hypothetical protein
VAQNPAAPAVQVFMNNYFTAINAHDYASYRALLDSTLQASYTPQDFASGYGSTSDSAATVTGISATDTGQTSVSVTFTSHQSAAQSASGTACTTWNITLFLTQAAAGYVDSPAPPGYHAAFRAC